MDVFPFDEADWQRVQSAALAVVNATLADDHVLHASQIAELVTILEELRVRYGNHPILRETEADFLDDPAQQVETYRLAVRLAEQNALPTLSIRISLARVLLEDFSDPDQAAKELTACQRELSGSYADEWEKKSWSELMAECEPVLKSPPGA